VQWPATSKTMINKRKQFVLEHIRNHPIPVAAILLAGFANSCVSFLLPVSIGEFFALHFHTGSSKGELLSWMGIHLHTMQGFYILFIILLLLKAILSFVESFGSYKQGELFVKNIREILFATQMSWMPELLSKNLYGKYLLRYSNDMKAIQNYFTKGIMDGIKNLLFLMTGLFMLSRINLTLTVILFSILLVILTITYFISRLQRPSISTSRSYRSSLLAFVTRSFSRFEKLKQRQAESDTIKNFNGRSDNLYRANMHLNKIESLLQSSSYFLVFSTIGILLWQMTMSYSRISASDGLMMILMVLMMQGALKKILKVPGYLNKGKISLEKINKVLQQEIEAPATVVDVS
jgi:ABC-type multidrug transport system fused ATPase/permease subunit